jgi:hypothetical protein
MLSINSMPLRESDRFIKKKRELFHHSNGTSDCYFYTQYRKRLLIRSVMYGPRRRGVTSSRAIGL